MALPPNAEQALLEAILMHGNQSLNQASMNTGFGITTLRNARDQLLAKQLIRVMRDSGHRDELFVSYEANL